MKHQKNGYIKDGEWYPCNYKALSKDCQNLVNDLINSSNVSHRWKDDLKHMYFTKVVTIAYDSGRKRRKNNIHKIFERVRDKIFIFLSRFIVYIP
jgi:hypothetical protein